MEKRTVVKRTLERRPDLIETAILSKEDEKYLKKLKKACMSRNSMLLLKVVKKRWSAFTFRY